MQRRYDTNSVWVDFTIPNDNYGLTKHNVLSTLSESSTLKAMDSALGDAEIGKGNSPAAGNVEVHVFKTTEQPIATPTKAPSPTKAPTATKTKKPSAKPSKSPVKDDDDEVVVPSGTDDVVEPLPTSTLGYTTVVQMMSGLEKSDAAYDKFPKMMATVVAAALGVNVDDVSVSSVKTSGKTDDVAITYKIVDKYSMSKEQVKSLLEEQAKTMEAALAVNGMYTTSYVPSFSPTSSHIIPFILSYLFCL